MKREVDLERVFDIIYHADRVGGDYTFDGKKAIVLNKKQQFSVIRKAIQAFMQSSGCLLGNHVIQAFSGSADLPQLTKDMFTVTQEVPEFDTLWQESFRGVRLRRGQLEWEVADVTTGITFEIIPEGGRVRIYSVSGAKTSAKIDKYGAGIGITWEMIEGRKLYQFIDLMMDVRARLNDLWADTHYGLLATAGATNQITWQGVATDPVLDRDIRTINKGYEDLGEAVKDSGYGDVANARMLLYASPKLKARINQAMRATSPDIISGRPAGAASSVAGQIVEYNVMPRYTWNSAVPANKALLVLPANKVQNSIYLQELGLSERDIETLSEIRTYWTAFGAIVADADQVYELAFT